MALADYHGRGALAAAQIMTGFDVEAFRRVLEDTPVGLSYDRRTVESHEGQALLDMAVRLLARLYPTLVLRPGKGAEKRTADLADLAKAINPNIAIGDHAEDGVVVGLDAAPFERSIFAGSRSWTALLSTEAPQAVDNSGMPFGAGTAACLAAAAIFRRVLLDDTVAIDIQLSCLDGVDSLSESAVPTDGWALTAPAVLVGLGAIGEAVVWALARSPLRGDLHLVDHEAVEVSNLQRYVLAARQDEDAAKVTLAEQHLASSRLTPHPFPGEWAQFVAEHGYNLDTVLVALDSAADRRAVQAALPRWLANAWTQPGDLGVSTHSFTKGACLRCLYLPTGTTRNEDEIVAEALGVSGRTTEIRTLLHNGAPPPTELLDAIAASLAIQRSDLIPFEALPIRSLYARGICGGEVLPLGRIGRPRAELHVPLAHQSALAGVLLAARLARRAAGLEPERTEITRLNVLTNLPQQLTLPAAKDPRGICICQDEDYQAAYSKKWGAR